MIHLNIRGSLKLTKNGIISISDCRNIQDLNLSDVKCLNVNLFTHSKIQYQFLSDLLYEFKNKAVSPCGLKDSKEQWENKHEACCELFKESN